MRRRDFKLQDQRPGGRSRLTHRQAGKIYRVGLLAGGPPTTTGSRDSPFIGMGYPAFRENIFRARMQQRYRDTVIGE
jgi:hypothetical protein